MKMFKDLKAELASLSKQLQDLSEQIQQQGDATTDLKSSVSLAFKKIDRLKEVVKCSDESPRRKHLTSQPDSNREYLKSLNCQQVYS